MGMRFRKSFNYGPVRINVSKHGLGTSVGVKGCRYTKTADGKKRTTVSIPGTGLSYVSEKGKSKKKKDNSNGCYLSPEERKAFTDKWIYRLCYCFWLPMIILGGLVSLVSWFGFVSIGIGIVEFIYLHKRRKQKKGVK